MLPGTASNGCSRSTCSRHTAHYEVLTLLVRILKHGARITGPYCLLRNHLVVDGPVGAVGRWRPARRSAASSAWLSGRTAMPRPAPKRLRIGDARHRRQLRWSSATVHHGGVAEHAVDGCFSAPESAFW